jgi:sporulation integral membrane protein YlbJ
MKNRSAIFICLLGFVGLIVFSSQVVDSCRYALELCASLIIPSLFPFFVISILLNKLGLPGWLGKTLAPVASRLYGVTGAGASALLIGLTGGYPLGAAYIADMEREGAITALEGERLLAFCNNSGPAFIIGAVGSGVFHSSKIGLLLYLCHILAAMLTGLFFRQKDYCKEIQPVQLDLVYISQAFPIAVKQAVGSILNVCGFVLCFTVLVGVLDSNGYFSLVCGALSSLRGLELTFTHAALTGILELGSGVGAMRGLAATPLNLALAAGMLGWGGLSVHFQTKAVIADSNIKGALHFAGRLISASIGMVLAYVIGLVML